MKRSIRRSHGIKTEPTKLAALFVILAFTVLSTSCTIHVFPWETMIPAGETTPSHDIQSTSDRQTENTTAADTTTTPGTQLETTESSTEEFTESQTEETTYPIATLPPPIHTLPPPATTTTTTEETTSSTNVSGQISDEEMNAMIQQRFLSIHPDSRSGEKLTEIKNIVVHYVANPGSTADQNWRYFESNKPSVSAHFIIDLDGSILQCMPLDEVAWAVGTREGNYTSINIECCHPDDTGSFTKDTYDALVKLVSWLCNKFELDRDDVLRHYDYLRTSSSGITWRKDCPLYFITHPEEWISFKNSLILN